MAKMIYMRSSNGEVFSTENADWHKDCIKVRFQDRKEYCRNELRKLIKPGDTVYTILRSVSKSGMSREISCIIQQGEYIRNIDALVSDAIGEKQGKQGIRVSGCGMDMGFHLVHCLGYALWPDGTPETHSLRNGKPDTCGGYAIRHEWV